MELKNPRVRFAPAPTGMMHLGNIRTALMNYLIAQQKDGTFLIRIEDTDAERNFDPGAIKILEDLTWLGIIHTEGPNQGGNYGPYFQSQRAGIYERELQAFIERKLVYRCFCTQEELDKKRERQIALKKPPRYDRTCLQISQKDSNIKAQTTPFVWRMRLDHTKKVTIHDLAHGDVTFDLSNFSDFPITRQDGSVTFMFANFVDDVLMKIACVIRGEDHLSNTAGQAAMYTAAGITMPIFWHMPILCNIDGKKLSKRDFGFSLRDLKDAGFLPQAITNYLAIIGSSYKQEIMSMDELIKTINFEHITTTGQIKYDVEKLRWVNHKWICQTDTITLTQLCRGYLEESYPQVAQLSDQDLKEIISHVQQEMITLRDAVTLLAFYFSEPLYSEAIAYTLVPTDKIAFLHAALEKALTQPNEQNFLEVLKTEIKSAGITPKDAFSFVRYALTGSVKGAGIAELIGMLGYEKTILRITKILTILKIV